MNKLAELYRLKQLATHTYHLTVSRVVFFQDHEVLSDIYTTAESDFDAVIERMIGLGQQVDINAINMMAAQGLKSFPTLVKENSEAFAAIQSLNKQILSLIEQLCKSGISQGTSQLIGDQANKIEIEQYKLGQRLKK